MTDRDVPGERMHFSARALRPQPPAALTVSGTLRLSEVERPVLVLDTDAGPTYELRFPTGWTVEPDPGARVTVAGDVEEGLATTTQVGRVLRVRTLSRAD